MKRIIVLSVLLAAIGATHARADQNANDTVTSTATISIVSVSSSVATAITTNSKAMKYRGTFAVQNIGSMNVWCKFDNSVTVSGGWLISANSVLSIPITYYSGLTDTVIRLYCISETSATNLAVLEAF